MRFEAWGDFVPLTCRTHYGGILIALGRWEEAEHELLAAIRRFETGYRAARLFPLLRLAELRARQGRMEEAERLLDNIDWHAGAKRTLATIAFARGDLDLAGDLVRLCLETTSTTDPECPPLLAVLVDVQPRSGRPSVRGRDTRSAHGACSQLRGQPYARDRRPGPGARPSRSWRRGSGSTSGKHRSCFRSVVSCLKAPGRAPASLERSPPMRRQRRSARLALRSRPSSASAPRTTLIRPPLCSGSGGSGTELPEGPRRADQPRARRPCAPRRRLFQHGDRHAPLHQPPHGRAPRRAHPVEARRTKPIRGSRVRAARALQDP